MTPDFPRVEPVAAMAWDTSTQTLVRISEGRRLLLAAPSPEGSHQSPGLKCCHFSLAE